MNETGLWFIEWPGSGRTPGNSGHKMNEKAPAVILWLDEACL